MHNILNKIVIYHICMRRPGGGGGQERDVLAKTDESSDTRLDVIETVFKILFSR